MHTHAEPQQPADTLGPIGLMCGTLFLFAVLDVISKYLLNRAGLPVLQIIGVRFATATLLNFVLLGPQNIPRLLASRKPRLQMVRSAWVSLSTLLNWLALSHLRLDQTITIFFLTPLLVAGLAGPMLGEWVGWRRFMAILTGFLGVILVMRPGYGGIHWSVVFAFAATLVYAIYNISTRYLAAFDDASVTQFYTPLGGLVIFGPLAVLTWQWPVDWLAWSLLLSTGIIGGFGHWLLILAHRGAPAPLLSAFIYTELIWVIIFGYVVFGDRPDMWTLAGAAVVIASGFYLLFREARLKRAR